MKNKEKSIIMSIALMAPVLIMIISGLVLVIAYHTHHLESYENFLGFDRIAWRVIHIASASISSILLIYHLRFAVNWQSYMRPKKERRIKMRRGSILTLSAFVLSFILGYAALIIGGFDKNSELRLAFVEIHDKLSLVLIVFIILHTIRRIKPVLNYLKAKLMIGIG